MIQFKITEKEREKKNITVSGCLNYKIIPLYSWVQPPILPRHNCFKLMGLL